MICRGIGADDEDAIGFFNSVDGIGHGSRSECGGKTCHRRGVSEPGAVVHVVGAKHRAGQFLCQVVLLVGHFGGDKNADTVWAVLVDDLLEPVRSDLDGLVPAGVDEATKGFDHRLFESHGAIDMLVQIPSLDTEFSLADGMGFHWNRTVKLAVNCLEKHTAASAAVGAD